jgi:hypothetical protein
MLQQLKGQCNKNLAEFFKGPKKANKKEIKSHKLRCVGRDDKNAKERSKTQKVFYFSFRVKGSGKDC